MEVETLTIFRSRGKGDERVVYPIERPEKTYRRHYQEKPSFSTNVAVHQDIKKIMQKEDSTTHGSKDFDVYKKRLHRDADMEYLKQLKKAERRQEKQIKKEEKEQEKLQRQL